MDKRYEDMSLAQLKELAKEQGIKGISALKKNELAELVAQNAPKEHKQEEKAEKPAVEEPMVRKPTTKKPTTKKPTTQKPATQKPEAEKPAVQKPETEKPAVQKPETEKPAVQKPEVKKVTAEEPMPQRPMVQKPEVKKAATEKHVSQKPAIRKPEVKKLINEKTDIDKTTEEKLSVEKTVVQRPVAEHASQETENGQGVRRPMSRQNNQAMRQSRVSSDNRPTDNRPSDNRPSDSRPTDSRPTDSRPTDNRPTDNRPTDSRPTDNRPTDSRPTDSRPTDSRPTDNRPTDNRPTDNRPTDSRPSDNRSTDNRSDSQQNQSRQAQQDNRPQSQEERNQTLDSGETKEGILEVLVDGYGFIRCDNFLPGENDVYVSPAQIRKMNPKTGDFVVGNTKIKSQNEKFGALLYVKSINGLHPAEAARRKKFEDLTPIFPNQRLHLETPGCGPAMRMVDLVSPIGKGQRGMIVSQPKAGKTTLLKQIAKAIKQNHPEMHLIILLIDERPEEVTDMKESIQGANVEVIYSTFDELPENHKRVSEMVIERAKRLVEHGKDVAILLDSITRLARAYNLTVTTSGRTLSGGLDPAALHMPKRFFGAARNMREGGSLTILATALVETGSRMDDVVFEEFKGTGNMELVLDRSLSERRIFPAIDLPKSSTRREDLLLSPPEMEANYLMRRAFNSIRSDDAVERIINMFLQTKSNVDFVNLIKRTKILG